jgi:predicted Rossmann fold flavoprotein
VGIDTLESWPGALSGLTLKNVRLTAARGKKLLYNEQGELLLTHYGISGPLVLSLSALLPDDCEGQALQLDLKPALDEKTLDERLLRELAALGRKQLASAMDRLMPHSLGLALLELAGLSPALPAHGVTRECRRELVRRIKGVTLTVRGLRGYEEAVVTRGGVDVRGINPSTMGSKAVAGLYFAGEVLDVDALTGGFNLQIAFSTGALAGKSAAQYVTRDHGGG